MKPHALLLTIPFLMIAVPAPAQDRLTLADAVARVAQHPAVRASRAAVGEAGERIAQARAGYLPRVTVIESAQRGNQPVFAFGALLAARRFTPADFAIGALNYPGFISNYQTSLSIDQPVFDGFRTRSAMRAASIGRDLALATERQTGADLALGAIRAYGAVLMASAGRKSADAAVQSAEQDVARAERRRDAGVASEADVLSLRVQLAQMRERAIRAASDETIARAELNQAIGEPLDRRFVLEDARPPDGPIPPIADLERQALASRPEVRAAALQQALAHENQRGARAAFLPQISVQGMVALNGTDGSFADRPSSWIVGAQAQWTAFSGLADVARLRETGLALDRAAADRERLETSVRVEVRTAVARVESARARQQVGEAAVAQARESQRIIRDRYDAGLASVNDVLRAATAVLDAESQRTSALVDLLVSGAMLDRAVGRLK